MLRRSALQCRRYSTQLTAKRYPHVKRRTDLQQLSDKDVTHFETLLGANGVLLNDLEAYNTDWLGIYRGASQCVLRPSTSAELSAVLRYCNERRLGVCVQSGNTGLVGGSVPVHDELVISMQRLQGELHVDGDTGIVRTGAGRILQAVDEELATYGYRMPYDLGAKGSCMIGGNVATAAGGIRFLRYGSIHAHLLALKVVLPNGAELELGSECRKDNTGLHLPHLFVGAEGQLGIITEVTMNAAPKPRSVNVAMLTVPNYASCLAVLRKARECLGEVLSGFELIDAGTMECVTKNLDMTCPLGASEFYILVESAGSEQRHDEEKMSAFLEQCIEESVADDGVIATNETQAAHMWALRERGAEALRVDGYTYKQDISLPLEHYVAMRDVMRERLGDKPTRVVLYGHLADGNAHLNVTSKQFDPWIQERMYPFLYQWVQEHRGSISAEHGIGFSKRPYAHYSQHASNLRLMREIKNVFDPHAIINPYKTIPE